MKKWKGCSLLVCIALFAAAVYSHTEVAQAVVAAGNRCVMVIIPSLYLCSVLAAFCIRTGLLETAAVPLNGLSRKLLRMDGIFLLILLFSQIAGYPVGAQLVRQMLEKGSITALEARRMLCCCFGCGPAFLLGTVGGCLGEEACVLLMAAVILPNFVLGLVLMRGCRADAGSRELSLHASDLTAAAQSGASAMLKIFTMIVLFAALTVMFRTSSYLPDAAAPLLEISNLTEFLRQGGGLPAAAAFLSFGGLCVHVPNAAIYGENFPFLNFWTARLGCAACTYWLCHFGLRFCFGTAAFPTALQLQPYEPKLTQEGILPVLCLVVMALLLLDKASLTGKN